MPTRHATTAWKGGFQNGEGTVTLADSQLGTFDVSFPKRASVDGDSATNPEELIAAAHSACYAMALSAQLESVGGVVESLDVEAAVTLGPDPEGGFRITGIDLTVSGKADGVDAQAFEQAAQAAKVGCPVSKALAGTDIRLHINE